jgi:hypothetical protein
MRSADGRQFQQVCRSLTPRLIQNPTSTSYIYRSPSPRYYPGGLELHRGNLSSTIRLSLLSVKMAPAPRDDMDSAAPGAHAGPGTSSEPTAGPRQARIRSRVACQACNRRKVRCDVAQAGLPCSNCKHESGACTVLPRKKHRYVALLPLRAVVSGPNRRRELTPKL